MKIPFLALIFQGIPESIAIITLAFVIAKIPLNWKKIVIIGLITTLFSYLIRLLPVTFGIHTVLLIGLLFCLTLFFGKGDANKSLIASLLSVLTLIVSETICLALLMPLFGVTSDLLFSDVFVRILITLPQVFVVFAVSIVVYRFSNK